MTHFLDRSVLSYAKEKNNIWTPLIILVFIGLVLRIVGASWGFPSLMHPDERVIADMAYWLVKKHTLNPDFYARPNHFSIYLHSILYSFFSYLVFHKSLSLTFYQNINTYYEYSRIIIALFGTCMVIIGYLIGREFSNRMGLYCALIFSIFPPFIEHSHYITPDIPVTLLLLVVVLFFIKYARNGSKMYSILSSIFIALAVSEKYPGIIVFPILLLLIILVKKETKKIIWEIILCGTVFIAALFFSAPYLFIEYPRVIQAIIVEARPHHIGADGLGFLGNLFFYTKIFSDNVGIIGSCLFFMGGFWAFKKEKFHILLPLFSGFLYWIGLSYISLHWDRWALPMYISPLIFIAYALDKIHPVIINYPILKVKVIFNFLLTIFVLNLFFTSLAITTSFTLQDTRNIGKKYAILNGITKDNSISDKFSIFYPIHRGSDLKLNSLNKLNKNKTKIKYIILSDGAYTPFHNERERYKIQNDFYAKIFKFTLLKEFSRTTGPSSIYLFSPVPFFFEPLNLYYQIKIVFRNLFFWDQSFRGPVIGIYQAPINLNI